MAIYLDLEDWRHKSLYFKHISVRGRPDWLRVISSILLSRLQNPQLKVDYNLDVDLMKIIKNALMPSAVHFTRRQ